MGNTNVYGSLFYTDMDKKIEHLGSLNGKILVFGGVYSNLQALEALIDVANMYNIESENCICTGDIIGYCAQPEETLQLFRKWGAKSISGNVELQLFDDADDCGCDFTIGSRCDGFSKLWYPYAKERISKGNITWIGTLPNYMTFDYADKKVAVVHGSVENVSEFIFKSTADVIKLNTFIKFDADIVLAGHCGLPFSQEINKKKWLNSGVIGMPANDGSQRVWYLIIENHGGDIKYTHQYLEYDYQTAFDLMKANNLPMEYAETLLSGLWDNMEVLPDIEKKLKGIPYNFN